MDKGGFHSDLVGMTIQVVWCNGPGWILLGFGWHDCTGCLVQWTRVDFTRIWLPCLSKELLAMEQGGFHSDLVGMTVQVVWCNGPGWISLGFGWHDCTGCLAQWTRVDFTRMWLA